MQSFYNGGFSSYRWSQGYILPKIPRIKWIIGPIIYIGQISVPSDSCTTRTLLGLTSVIRHREGVYSSFFQEVLNVWKLFRRWISIVIATSIPENRGEATHTN
jgi:hypothetical protein